MNRTQNRCGECERRYFRCERFFTVGHQWYAATREGTDLGPFLDRHQVELALARHVAIHLADFAGRRTYGGANGARATTALEILIEEMAACLEQVRLRSETRAYVWAAQRRETIRRHAHRFEYPEIRARALDDFLSGLDG